MGAEGFEPPTLPPKGGMLLTRYQLLQPLPAFPRLDLTFTCIRKFLRGKLLLIKNFPIIGASRKSPVVWIVFSQPLFKRFGSMTYIIFARTLRKKNVEIRNHVKQKRPQERPFSGSWGVRTPDPLLVRQMLWTSWAKLPFLRTAKVKENSFCAKKSCGVFRKGFVHKKDS